MLELDHLLDRLSRRFKAEDVYIRERKFHYISAERTIDRFNEVLPLQYNWRVDEITHARWPVDTSTGKAQFAAWCRGHITLQPTGFETTIRGVFTIERGGVGAGVNADLDMVLKTAQAEAFKKAGHQFGVGLYLWDETERKLVDLIHAGEYAKAASLLCRLDYNGNKDTMLVALNATEPEAILKAAELL